MFSALTKESIKVALSICIAISLAIYFQWSKPYWAAIAVAVMAMNESFGHSIQKGYNRLFGTLLGVAYSFFLVAMFSQDRFLFLTFFALFLSLAIFMSTDEKYGYIFTMGFSVCSIIVCMGGFDSQLTFDFAITRIQETVLGVIVFTVIYRILWPVDSYHSFLERFNDTKSILIDSLSNRDVVSNDQFTAQVQKLRQLINLPLTGNYEIRKDKATWLKRTNEMYAIYNHYVVNPVSADPIEKQQKDEICNRLASFDSSKPEMSLVVGENLSTEDYTSLDGFAPTRSFGEHVKQDYRKVLHGLSIFLIGILAWIYIPVPGGFIFPMLAAIMGSILPTMPNSVIKNAFIGMFGLGPVIVAQYVLIMPYFTELWQLAGFYFFNTIVLWRIFYRPQHLVYRILGVNLLVSLTTGAMSLTPVYRIETSLLLMVTLTLVLMIAKVVGDIFAAKPAQ